MRLRALKAFGILQALARVPSLLVVFLVITSFGQEKERRIGSIDFYGYAGLNLDQISHTLPIHVGDAYPGPRQTIDGVNKAVVSVIGRPPTDVTPVCCDAQGNYMIYVGLPGASIKDTRLNPVPKGKIHFPAEVIKLYEETMAASSAAVLKGNADEDSSKGYALSTSDPDLRAKQLTARAYALRHEKLIRDVMQSSSEAQQRIVAAYLLGYARQSSRQITSLTRASNDADETVRNNATRALGVLAESNAKVAARIPSSGFIRMLSSGSWSDRNKAGWVLSTLTRSRDPKLLAQLRSEALDPLIEMARWRSSGHAYTARILLGRVAGIEEGRLRVLVDAQNVDAIIKAIQVGIQN
jgi:hypothetical protein